MEIMTSLSERINDIIMTSYISNTAHYTKVLSRVKSVKQILWIGSADIKDLYVEIGKEAYIGSANLTGAGIGMKSDNKRNFEAGILTNDHQIVELAMNQFDEVWMGKHCKSCKRREYCQDPIK